MEFRNLTPHAAITFGALDTRDQEYHVVALRVGYGLKPLARPRYDDPALVLTHRCEALDGEAMPLVMTDDYWGEPGRSSLRQESDLAPYKPRCDVLVNATAHAPGGQPAARWPVRLRVIAPAVALDEPPPAGLNPWMAPSPAQLHDWRQRHEAAREQAAQARLLLDKTLTVTGPRAFRRRL